MIRNAEHRDIERLIELGEAMHQESVYRDCEFNKEKVAELLSTLIDVESGIAIVNEVDEKITGGFIGCVFPHWFGNDLQATDYALFIDPTNRGGIAGVKLIKEYVRQARNKGAKQISIGNSTGYKIEETARLFELCGFVRCGFNMNYQYA